MLFSDIVLFGGPQKFSHIKWWPSSNLDNKWFIRFIFSWNRKAEQRLVTFSTTTFLGGAWFGRSRKESDTCPEDMFGPFEGDEGQGDERRHLRDGHELEGGEGEATSGSHQTSWDLLNRSRFRLSSLTSSRIREPRGVAVEWECGKRVCYVIGDLRLNF